MLHKIMTGEYEVSVITKSHVGREGNTLTRALAGEENSPLNNNKRLCEVVSLTLCTIQRV